MIRIQIEANSVSELQVHAAALHTLLSGPPAVEVVNMPLDVQPAKRTRKPKGEDKPDDHKAVDPRTPTVDALATQHTSAESMFATTEAPAPAKQPEQKDLIAAFRVLNDKKGTNAIVALIGEYGAKTVALIPNDKWAAAITAAFQRTGLTPAQWAEALKALPAK